MLPEYYTTQSSAPPAYSPESWPSERFGPNTSGFADNADGDSDAARSSVCLRVNAAVSISGDHNCICITKPPADHVNTIVRAALNTIKENSSGQCGIPMVDEDGRPRPVIIEVEAGMMVHGTDNAVGNENAITGELRRRGRIHSHNEVLQPRAKRGRAE
jgi:hypothetical protein